MPQWRVHAAAATSFRAPTLYQRFSRFGNAGLSPESGRSVEWGLRWNKARHELGLVAWRNKVTNLIVFDTPGVCLDRFGCFRNVGRTLLKGVTLSGRTALHGVALRGSLEWHDPRDLATGNVLPRRAKTLATLGADTAIDDWSVGAEVQAAGERYDNAANTVRLGGYGLVNVHASTTMAPNMVFEARIDNLGGKTYELARYYTSAGRSAQITLRWTL